MKKMLIPAILCSTAYLSFNTSPILAEEIEDLKKQIESSKENIDSLENEKSVVSMSIGEIETAIETLKSEIKTTNEKITSTENEITLLSKEIEDKKKEIKKLENKLVEKKEVISRNLKIMEQKGDIPFVEYLFTAENLPDLFSRFNNLKDVANANEKIYEEIRDKNEEVKKEKQSLESSKALMVVKKKELVSLTEDLAKKEASQKTLLKEYENKYAELEHEIDEQEEGINVINNQIAEIIAQREAERKKREAEAARKAAEAKARADAEAKAKAEAEAKGKEYIAQSSKEPEEVKEEPYTDLIGSGFSLPLKSGSYSISSEFGWRTHPIYGTQKLHAGIDMAAPTGTPIYASDSGTVLYSGPASGYGNWIVIDHNNGYYSIYAHMYSDQLYVNVSEQVSKGQNIGAVGSSGGSTGAHLHFEISKGGISSANKLNPRSFLSF